MNPQPPYAGLTPELILNALEGVDLAPDGRLLALNSYENRVYQAWLAEGAACVVKFYRPGRWSDSAILEDHAFVNELAAREIPVVAPLALKGATLHHQGDFAFAVFPRQAGRAPELFDGDTRRWMGRFLGRIHGVGAMKPFIERPALDYDSFGAEPAQWLLDHAMIPDELMEAWFSTMEQALEGVEQCYDRAGEIATLRLHGDCHLGNVLWVETGPEAGPHFVDFDDARSGPAIQDLWMLLSGSREEMAAQMRDLLLGYEQFTPFARRELHLLEALRTLRLIHYSAWLARRWSDPAFPIAFPWFGTKRYWQDRVLELREQISAMTEAPLPL